LGYGDALMASGMARGLGAQGKRAAFGDGRRIIWGPWENEILAGNPNVAPPGSERASDLVWIEHYKGHRAYNRALPDRWVWTQGFRPQPGEVYFTAAEKAFADGLSPGFVAIEPDVPAKDVADNKRWPRERFAAVAEALIGAGWPVVQFGTAPLLTPRVRRIETPSFRHAVAALSRAALYIGTEGGLHHGSAAVGIPAVVIFGGFIPPETTGYETHANLFSGGVACGMRRPCPHCRKALEAITVDMVVDAALERLET